MRKKRLSEELFNEWSYEHNKGINPEELNRTSVYNAWWKCSKCNGLWQSKVKTRSCGSGCPYCAGHKVLSGVNDLKTLYPTLAEEWISSENEKTSSEVTTGSHEKVLWECSMRHRWMAEVKTRTSGNGCPYCSGRYVIQGKNDLQTLYPKLMDEWDWRKNVGVTPAEVTSKSGVKYWWICRQCGYEWKSSPAVRTRADRANPSGCPCCNNKVVVPGKNDAATYNPDVASEWDPELNGGKSLSDFVPGSMKYGTWTCKKYGLTWRAQIRSRIVYHKGCPYCSGKSTVPGVTDLTTVFPDIAQEWNIEKNDNLTPSQVTPYSNRRVWWTCKYCNHVWVAKVANRTLGRGCPRCAAIKQG